MKKLLLFMVVALTLCPCAFADYYRASGGGVYELYVDDCSESGMRRALDNATASRRAVITSVKCAAPRAHATKATAPVMPVVHDIYIETVPADCLCPCALVETPCGC